MMHSSALQAENSATFLYSLSQWSPDKISELLGKVLASLLTFFQATNYMNKTGLFAIVTTNMENVFLAKSGFGDIFHYKKKWDTKL